LVLPKARDPSPSSYFPNSFGREFSEVHMPYPA
jgi:hypothetical protein